MKNICLLGGIVSLQIAAEAPSVKAVVAHFALADFEKSLDVNGYSFRCFFLDTRIPFLYIQPTLKPVSFDI